MIALVQAAAEIEAFLVERDWQFCFIGGLALQRWGQPRVTNDVDVTVLAGFGREATYVDALLQRYRARVPEARGFALKHRVVLLESTEGVPVDVALGGIAFEEKFVSRASRFEFLPGVSLTTCSAEDLIVLKAFADRPRDWVDVATITIRHQGQLDWCYILEQLVPLCQAKEAPEIVERVRQMQPRSS